jgi:thiosulfate dehydrogenase [quinone] large subunit
VTAPGPLPPGLALLPLRLFLGVTFAYAGVHKLTDAGFLHAGSETYIGDQLEAFAEGTPGGLLLETFALPAPVLAGIGVALAEVAIGLLAIAGRFTRSVAVAGLGLSLVLFLTASWHTVPYFLGSDIVFVFAWLPFVLAGAAGQPALDHRSHRAVRVRRRGRIVVPVAGEPLTRRAALAQALGFTAAATGAIAGISLLARGAVPARAVASKAAAGTAVAESASLAAGNTLTVTANGATALVIRGADGGLTAFSAVCTHAGCDVIWRDGEIRCPCHHARFDPATGEPTKGPARMPLAPLEVVERDGKIVLS